MTLEIVALWVFLLQAQVHGDLRVTQIAQFDDRETCERIREAHRQSAVSPVCFRTYVQSVRRSD